MISYTFKNQADYFIALKVFEMGKHWALWGTYLKGKGK